MEKAGGCSASNFASPLSSKTCQPPLLQCFIDGQERSALRVLLPAGTAVAPCLSVLLLA